MRLFIVFTLQILFNFSAYGQKEYHFFDIMFLEDKVVSFQYLDSQDIFVAGTSNGKGLIVDNDGLIIETFHFANTPIHVFVNPEESVVAFSGNDKWIRFSRINEYSIYDSVFVPSAPEKSIHSVFFTKNGILINQRTGDSHAYKVLRYAEGKFQEVKGLNGYLIYDYDPASNMALIGKWNPTDVSGDDLKVKEIYKASVANPTHKFLVHAHVKPVVRAFYLNHGKDIISVSDMVRSTNTQLGDEIRSSQTELNSKTVIKVDDVTVAVVSAEKINVIDTQKIEVKKRVDITNNLNVGKNESNVSFVTNKFFYLVRSTGVINLVVF